MKTFIYIIFLITLSLKMINSSDSESNLDTKSVQSSHSVVSNQTAVNKSNLSITDQTDKGNLSVGDLNDLMKEDPNFSNDSEFDQDFAQVKNSKLSLDEDNSWVQSIDNDLDDSTNQNSSTGTISKNSLDFDEDDEDGGNVKAKIEILEITADNRTSYTEMQSLVRYMETDLHIQQFGNETGFKDNFDERMKKLDKDSLDDIQ